MNKIIYDLIIYLQFILNNHKLIDAIFFKEEIVFFFLKKLNNLINF